MKKKTRPSIRTQLLEVNSAISLLSSLLYSGLFLFAMGILLSRIVNSNTEHALKEMMYQTQDKFGYLEEVALDVSESDVILDFLSGKEIVPLWNEEFNRIVSLNHPGNILETKELFLKQVTLVRADGNSLSTGNERNVKYPFWEDILSLSEDKEDTGFIWEDGDLLCLVKKISNQFAQGYLLSEIDKNGLSSLLEKASSFTNSFWVYYTGAGERIDSFGTSIRFDTFPFEPMEEPEPVEKLYQGQEFQVIQKEVFPNLWLEIGIPKNHEIKKYTNEMDWIILVVLLFPIVILLSFYFFTYKITKPLEEIREKIQYVQKGDFETKLPTYHEKEFYEISENFNSMTTSIKTLIKESYEKQLLIKEQEIKFLQSQIDPHFIFNVLNSFALTARMEGNKDLSETISTFSQLIQAKIYRSDKEEVQIKQELEYVKYYLHIQKFRFEDKITYDFQVEEELVEQFVPKLSIQTLVENAIVHGIEPKQGVGHVWVRCYRNEKFIVIEIEDNGVGFETDGIIPLPIKGQVNSKNHNQVGLNNLDSLIRLKYGEEYGLNIFNEKGKRTIVKLLLPYCL